MIAPRGVAQSHYSSKLGPVTRYRHALAACALCLALSAPGAPTGPLWVGPGGDDANPGTEERPLKTIARARDIVRTLNHDMSDDITVFIAGVHRLSAPIEFGPEDSATNGFSVVYTAAPGEHPVITGAAPVPGWSCVSRERNLWSAPAPAGAGDVLGLYVNGSGAHRTRARLPRVPAAAEGAPTPTPRPPWRNPGDVAYLPAQPGAIWSERAGAPPLYAENAFELLGRPGEWYFDRQARAIYYTPRPGEDLGSADAEAVVAPAFLVVEGLRNRPVEGLVLKGLRFEYAAPAPAEAAPGAAVRFALAGPVQLLEDSFLHLAGPALDLGPGCDGAIVEGCVFSDVSRTALRVAWASQVRVAESRFSYVSTGQIDGAAISLSHSEDVEVGHCQIDHFPATAVLMDGERPGAARIALNTIAPPMVGGDASPPEEAPAAPDASPAGVTADFASILAEALVANAPPQPPVAVSAEAEEGFAYVTWDPPCLDGGSDVVSYMVSASTGAAVAVTAAQFRSKGFAVVQPLENGREASFTVTAVNANGASPPSIPSAAVTPAHKRRLKAPQPPASASLAPGQGVLTLRILPPASDGGSPVVAYILMEAPSGRQMVIGGRDVIRADASHPVVRPLGEFAPGPGSTLSVRAANAKGAGAPLEIRAPGGAPVPRPAG